MKKELYVSPEIKVLSYHFEAVVCVVSMDNNGEMDDGGDL